jgi:hypothetical protein
MVNADPGFRILLSRGGFSKAYPINGLTNIPPYAGGVLLYIPVQYEEDKEKSPVYPGHLLGLDTGEGGDAERTLTQQIRRRGEG